MVVILRVGIFIRVGRRGGDREGGREGVREDSLKLCLARFRPPSRSELSSAVMKFRSAEEREIGRQ